MHVASGRDGDVFDLQLGLTLLARDQKRHRDAIILDHVVAHLRGGAFTHTQDVVEAPGLERGHGRGADHPPVGNHAGPLDAEPGAQALDHLHQGGHIGGVAGPQKRGERAVRFVENDPKYHLREVRPVVLGMPTASKVDTTLAFEPQRGGVVERHRDRAEQRPAVAIECFLDRFRHDPSLADVLSQPSHRFVGMVEGEVFGTRDLEPPLPAAGVAIRARHHQPVQHRQIDRPLQVEPKLPIGQQVFEHRLATGLDPQSAKYQIGSDARPPQLPELTAIETRQHDRTSRMACRRGHQGIDEAGSFDLVAAAKRLDHALHMPAALARVLDQIEIIVRPDLLDPDEHGMESSCDSRQSPHIYASINMNRRRMLYHLAPQNDPRSETRCSSRAFPSAHRKSVEVGFMYGRRPRCKRNLTISEAFGCSHVSGL